MGEFRLLEEQFVAFQKDMLEDAPDETVAACTAGWWRDGTGQMHLVFRSARLARDDDYVRRGAAGAQVTPEFLAPTVKRCRNSGEALVLAHTHPFSTSPGFSGIDDGGEDVLIPKVRDRAPVAPHGGFVLGRDSGSARAWPADASAPIELRVRRLGMAPDHGTSHPEYHRQELAFGPGTAATLGTKSIAVIGTGGLGWEASRLLWGHGVGRLIAVDPDVLADHNRPRLSGSRREQLGMAKVNALAECLRPTRSEGEIISVAAPFADRRAREVAATADVLVVATDNLASRLDADRFARRVGVPLVDAGINVQLASGRLRRVGGRVNVSWPLGPCLMCMGVLSPDAVAAEVDPVGYRAQGRAEEAAVLAFNAVVAGLAANEVLALLLPFRADPRSSRYLVYDGLRGLVREIAVPAPGSCGTCVDLLGAVFGELP